MNLCNRFLNFFSKFLDPCAHFTGGLQEFDDLLLHKAFWRAWFFWALGYSTAFFDGFGAEDAGCRKDFSRGESRDFLFHLCHFSQQGFFFLGKRKKCRQSLCVDVCYFH